MKILPSKLSQDTTLDRADLLRQARGVFGVDSTMQLFGGGGRIITEDGRKLEFSDLAELERLVAAELEAPPPKPELQW